MPTWSKDAAVAYHTVRWDDQLGDFELIEYDEYDAVVTRTMMRRSRGGEPGELIRFASDGAEMVRKTYTDPVNDPAKNEFSGESIASGAVQHGRYAILRQRDTAGPR